MVGSHQASSDFIVPITEVELRFETLRESIVRNGNKAFDKRALENLEQSWSEWMISAKCFIKRLQLEEENIAAVAKEHERWDIERHRWEAEQEQWILSKDRWEEESDVWGSSTNVNSSEETRHFEERIQALEKEVKQLRHNNAEEKNSKHQNPQEDHESAEVSGARK